ncbi:hypothetical protein [uncultured Nocardioides sp.]|uniref:hypothetical protein n=1 Tax=uncultured Nocardioides sp. TaxID=198441 RepID=UPI00261A9C3E|nr:hypothetical protein [uncultured Nocardioides sp.]
MTRPHRPDAPRLSADERARRKRTEALERLDALETPTEAQRALRRRLRALEETDPATANERELRRVLGLK